MSLDPWQRKTLFFLLALVVVTLLGPFGTYSDMTMFERLVFWTIVLLGAGFFVHFSVTLLLGLESLQHVTRPTRILLGACAGAVPGVAVVAFVERVMRPPGMPLDTQQLILVWWQVALISVVIAMAEYWHPYDADDGEEGAVGRKAIARTPFHDRLPRTGGGPEDIVSLTMQDHYVEVATPEHKHLVLIRLSDAIRELDSIEGLQVHRSHWVASGHVRGLRREGHRHWVKLSDGRELSVSKTYLNDVKALLK